MKPVCRPCQRFFRPKKNGFAFVEGMPIGPDRPLPGTQEPEKWKPYKLWMGDLWHCQGCGAEIVVGVAPEPLAEHYQPDFEAKRASYPTASYIVNDC